MSDSNQGGEEKAKLIDLLDNLIRLLGIDESGTLDDKIEKVLEKVVYYSSLNSFSPQFQDINRESLLEVKEKMLELKERLLENKGELKEEDLGRFKALVENAYKDLEKMETDLINKERFLDEREKEILERENQIEGERKKIMDYISMAKEQYMKMLDEEMKRKEQEFKARVKFIEQKEEDLSRKTQMLISQEIDQTAGIIQEEINIKKIKTGVKKLDDLLKGGVPMGSNTMMIGPPFSGKEELSQLIEVSMVQRGLPLVIITFDKPAKIILDDLRLISPIIDVYMQLGRFFIIDTFSLSAGLEKSEVNGIIYIQSQTETKSVIESSDGIVKNFPWGIPPVFFMYGITSLMNLIEKGDLIRFFQIFTTKRKSEQTLSFYILDNQNIEDPDVQAIAHLMDGLVLFKKEGSKSFLQIQGLTDVESRDWIETEFSKNSFNLKSFTLSKIR